MESLLAQYAGLIGVAAGIALVINVLKAVGIVNDGSAQNWSAALNLFFMVLLLAFNIFAPDVDIAGLDAKILAAVEFASVIIGYLLQLLGSKVTHEIVRGVSVIGKSFSE